MSDRDTTGGWLWHARAFFRRRQWRATPDLIADWLDGVQPAHKELLLIGGSAGWMMSSRWLQRFERIVLIDIDPYARTLFRWNHGRVLRQSSTRLEFVQCDALRDLEALLSVYPNASIFFDNVLGQHVYRVTDFDRAEKDLNQIAHRLAGRDWGSVHDLFSGPAKPTNYPHSPR
jgi:pimeloyl-ACP methyl ester carboxylesterase